MGLRASEKICINQNALSNIAEFLRESSIFENPIKYFPLADEFVVVLHVLARYLDVVNVQNPHQLLEFKFREVEVLEVVNPVFALFFFLSLNSYITPHLSRE